jgi:arylsulfatase A-like enzyme
MSAFRIARFLVLLALTGAGFVLAAASRPNVLLVLADDMGVGDVSCLNPRSAWRTPSIDRLAGQGMVFLDAHSSSGVCTPTRYTLLTGRYSWRGRLKQGVLQGYGAALIEPGRLTLPGFLRAQGYATAMFGKWHLGLDWQRTGPNESDVDFARPVRGGPVDHGFERFLGISASLDMPPYVWLRNDRATQVPTGRVEDSPSPKLWRGGPIAKDFQMEDVQPRIVDETIAFLGERAAARDGRPFFVYLALASPHTPILPTKEFAGRTPSPYGDFVLQLDADVGRLTAALERLGLADNTVVVFTSDNGFAPAADIPRHAGFGHDPSGGFRGVKSDAFEGGHHVPFIVRWPGVTSAGSRCREPVGQFDLFATLAETLGQALPANVAEDSESLLPLLRGQSPRTTGREAVVHHSVEGRFAIRAGRWKLILWPGSGGWSAPTPAPSPWLKVPAADLSKLPPFQLYDLDSDPAETTNLASAHPEIVQRLGRLLRSYIERGRSTAGVPQPAGITAEWKQLSWLGSFASSN